VAVLQDLPMRRCGITSLGDVGKYINKVISSRGVLTTVYVGVGADIC